MLPAISNLKVFEKAVHAQLSNYFITNDFLFDSQYGFRSHHSTEHAVLELIDQVSLAIDKGCTPLSIFLDLSKAFDTLNHGILLQKLKFYGINGVSLSWFKSYLQNRVHYVELQPSIRSSNISLTTGVPQGSILGPLLYIIYVNDIQHSSEYFKFIIYADDTTLVKPLIQFDKNINHININTELTNIHEWLSINKLSINTNKTKFMIFHGPRKKIKNDIALVKINDKPIQRVSEINFLGIILSENLSWINHIDKISKTISRNLGIINKLKHFVPLYILKTLYYSLVQSYMLSGILAWGHNTTKVFKLQKKAMRIITNSNYISHTDPIFKDLKILKIEDLYKINILKLYFQVKTPSFNCLPRFFSGLRFHCKVRCSFI